jgi:hypothetical protein
MMHGKKSIKLYHIRISNEQILTMEESRKRPGVAQSVPGGLGSQIFMTFGT